MSLKNRAAGLAVAVAFALPSLASAETLIRIQSVIPTSADEVVMLEDFAADVTALTNGEVRLRGAARRCRGRCQRDP